MSSLSLAARSQAYSTGGHRQASVAELALEFARIKQIDFVVSTGDQMYPAGVVDAADPKYDCLVARLSGLNQPMPGLPTYSKICTLLMTLHSRCRGTLRLVCMLDLLCCLRLLTACHR